MKSDCPITISRVIYRFIFFVLSSDWNSVQLLRAAYCTSFLCNIDRWRRDDVNKLHRSYTVKMIPKVRCARSFPFQKINCLKERPNVLTRAVDWNRPVDRNGVIIILCIGVKLNQLKPNENVIPAPWENNCPGIAGLRQRAYISGARVISNNLSRH